MQEYIICELTGSLFEGNPQMHYVAMVEVLACITLPKLIIVTSCTNVVYTTVSMRGSAHTPNSQCHIHKINSTYALKNPAPYGTPVDKWHLWMRSMYVHVTAISGYPTHHYHSNTYMYSTYMRPLHNANGFTLQR